MREQTQAEFLARSRQDWINSLRDAVASFLTSGNAISSASEKLHNRTPPVAEGPEDLWRASEVYDQLYSDVTESLTKARLHYAKVQLYTNPLEQETQDLISAMNAYIDAAIMRRPTADLGNTVVNIAQKIIKNEWVRVKSMNL